MAKNRKPPKSEPAPPPDDDSWSVSDPDQKIPGMDKSLRELLDDPEMLAGLQAQMPGVDLSGLLQPGGDFSFDGEDDDEDEVADGFRSLGLRVDLLDREKSGLYWCFKVPEWLTLGGLHRVLSAILGRSNAVPYSFEFPYESFHLSDEARTHPDGVHLHRAFAEVSHGFYASGESVKIPGSEVSTRQWGFLIRCVRKFTHGRGDVELLRLAPFPPADSPDPQDYLRRLKANELTRSEPFEVLERRLRRYVDSDVSRLGPYLTEKMSLPTLLFAILQIKNEPATPAELTHRAYLSDVPAKVSLSTVKKALSKAPFVTDPDGLTTLDRESAAFKKAASTLEKALGPVGPRLIVRRFTSTVMTVQGQPTDIILVVDDERLLVHAHEVCTPWAGVQPMLDAVDKALQEFPQAVAVVTEDPLARGAMMDLGAYATESRLSVDEPLEPFLTMEQEMGESGYSYPAGLAQPDLARFSEAALGYYLLAPWVLLSDSDLFEIEGLTPKPLIVSILGQGHEVYGLSLFESLESYRRFVASDRRSFLTFMDFNEAGVSRRLREQIRQAGGKLLDNDTFPFALGVGHTSPVQQYRLLTEVFDLIGQVVTSRGEVKEGTAELEDSQGRAVRVTYPVDRDRASSPSTSAPIQKPGRNEACWCGSGKKFKKCHG